MKNQLTLQFNSPESLKVKFEYTFHVGARRCFICRREDPIRGNYTFMSVGGLNLLGRPLGLLFRGSSEQGFTNGYYLPELDTLTLDELIGFAKHLIFLKETAQTEWDCENRRRIFPSIEGNYRP